MSHFNFDQMLSEAVELGKSFFKAFLKKTYFIDKGDNSVRKGEENCGSIKKRNGS